MVTIPFLYARDDDDQLQANTVINNPYLGWVGFYICNLQTIFADNTLVHNELRSVFKSIL